MDDVEAAAVANGIPDGFGVHVEGVAQGLGQLFCVFKTQIGYQVGVHGCPGHAVYSAGQRPTNQVRHAQCIQRLNH